MQSPRPDQIPSGSTRALPGPEAVTGLVLCGGASSRMGADKALIELDGGSLLTRAIDVLDLVAGQVLLACGSSPRYLDLDRQLVLDRVQGIGPLAGLAAGLEAATSEWSLVVACDMPRLDAGVLRALLERAHSEDLDLCLSRGTRGLEPMCAVYRRTCLPAIQAAIAAGEHRMVSFWKGPWAEARTPLRVGTLEIEQLGQIADAMINLNSPRDLEQEREHRAGMNP
ncbi:MAG: molybdopterin-guanine dinucleotide biosynthesis protein A [Chlamydiales bacterium]